eukprot:1196224-Prorocentrum_minimum.AAC.5
MPLRIRRREDTYSENPDSAPTTIATQRAQDPAGRARHGHAVPRKSGQNANVSVATRLKKGSRCVRVCPC